MVEEFLLIWDNIFIFQQPLFNLKKSWKDLTFSDFPSIL